MASMFLFIGNMGFSEWAMVLLIVMLLFGGKKIPELMRGFGKGIREFNSARAGMEDEIRKGMQDAERKPVEGGKEA